MTKSLTTLKDLKLVLNNLSELKYPILLTFEHGCWYIDDGEIHWNTDNNKEDLYHQDNNTYSAYLPEGSVRLDGFLVANCDTSTGTWCTSIFELDKELDIDELEELYGVEN